MFGIGIMVGGMERNNPKEHFLANYGQVSPFACDAARFTNWNEATIVCNTLRKAGLNTVYVTRLPSDVREA